MKKLIGFLIFAVCMPLTAQESLSDTSAVDLRLKNLREEVQILKKQNQELVKFFTDLYLSTSKITPEQAIFNLYKLSSMQAELLRESRLLLQKVINAETLEEIDGVLKDYNLKRIGNDG